MPCTLSSSWAAALTLIRRRFEKVGHLLHTLFSLLLCFVDMRIGIGECHALSLPDNICAHARPYCDTVSVEGVLNTSFIHLLSVAPLLRRARRRDADQEG